MMEEQIEQIGLPWFDWEVIAECEFPVPTSGVSIEVETDCGEPASYKVIWGRVGKDFVESMNTCKEHFEFVKKHEEEEEWDDGYK